MFRRSVVVAISTLAVCAAADNPPVRIIEEIAAKVNGDIITRGELEKKRADAEAEARRQGLNGVRLQEAVKDVTANALRDEIDQLLLVQKGKELNINVDGDVARRLAEIQVQAKKPNPDEFQAYVREQTGMTFEDFKDRMRRDILTQRVIGQEVMRTIVIPEPDMQKYYEEHKKEFVREEQVFLSQILISTEGKSPEQVAAAEKKAKDLVARARKGDKFSDLASANSDDPETAKNGGYIGAMKRGLMDKQIEDLVFKMKKGEVTDPIKRPVGFLVLKVEERFEAGQASFEEVKSEVQDRMMQPKAEPKVREYLSHLREDAFLQIKEGYVDSGAVPGKDTRWQDMAQLKPQTTTKEEVAAHRKKHILWVIPAGTAKDTKTKGHKTAPDSTPDAAPAPAPASAPATEPAKAADPAKPAGGDPAKP
ncbi:MAG TPA: peptidylprolyl isomerase [Candidatus Acidoferrales bacterium]|nr:peptidylprolyl isomerase [Candidatus Acidoferrales bacterium]